MHMNADGGRDIAQTPDDGITSGTALNERPLTQLHPDYVKVMRLTVALAAIPFTIAALFVEVAGLPLPGMALVPVAVLFIVLAWRVPKRRYAARGYDISDDRLQVVKGILFRSDIVVPFRRVQHLNLAQGPLERWYGLATLTLYTAGTHNASVSLPGLAYETASQLHEAIRAHVRAEPW